MKHKITTLLLCSILLSVTPPLQAAKAQEGEAQPEADSGAVICPPDVYWTTPDDCLPLGPSVYLTDMARMGITFPPRPLPAYPPDAELSKAPYYYFRVDPEGVTLYSSLADAQAKGSGGQYLLPGFVYVSYDDRAQNGGVYYHLSSGWWMPGKGARVSEISSFQGLLFRSTPRNSFAWAFEDIPVKSAPGYSAPDTRQRILPFQVIQVYSTQIVDEVGWELIGADQWVEGRKVASVIPNTTPPQGVPGGRWIEVNLDEQTLAVYDNYQLVFATMIASGMEPFWTKPGLFQIYQKKPAENMRGSDPSDFYYLENVPWTMYFDQLRALHGAYWRTRFGYPQSHGCVNLSLGDAHWLFDWAVEGDWVYVHDPSGKTPTDAALYTAGAP